MSNTIQETNAQCQVIWYVWETPDEDVSPDNTNFGELSRAFGYDMSDHIENVTFTKTLSSPTGQFTIRLDNTRDWKDVIKPGNWCVILMTQDGDLEFNDSREQREKINNKSNQFKGLRKAPASVNGEKIRCVGYIERVACDVQLDEDGAFNVIYEVAGRDYGVIYEETELWFNYLFYEKLNIESLSSFLDNFQTKTTSELIKFAHDFFFAPERLFNSRPNDPERSILSIGKQWLLPRPLLRLLKQNVPSHSFFGEIDDLLNLQDTGLQIPVTNPLTDIQSTNAWSKLKEYAITEFHELFTELSDDGKMRLNYRPIPWSFDRRGYPSLSMIKSFKDLANESGIKIFSRDLFSYNLGEDNHSRYNHFYMYIHSTLFSAISNISLFLNNPSKNNKLFPFKIGPSINRHGFRPMHTEVNSLSLAFASDQNGNIDKKNGEVLKPLLLEYCELLVDYWKKSVFFETGSVEIIGKNEIRLGKVLDFQDDILFDANKYFYIEGYSDEFRIGNNGESSWIQTINVTRGIEKRDLDMSQGFTVLKNTSNRENPQTTRSDFVKNKKEKN